MRAASFHPDGAKALVVEGDRTIAWFVERARWIAQLRASIKSPG